MYVESLGEARTNPPTSWQNGQNGCSARSQQASRRSVLMYVEFASAARTKLTAIFTILLRGDAAGQDNFTDMIQALYVFIGRPGIWRHGAHAVIRLANDIEIANRILLRNP